jgi:hypothetical protein
LRVEKRFSFVRDSAYLPLKNALASATNRSCDSTVSSPATPKSSPAYEALGILGDGDDLCNCGGFRVAGHGADASMAPVAALKDLFRVACSVTASLSTPGAYEIFEVTHPDPLCGAAVDLWAVELAAPVVVPDELFQVLLALPDRYRTPGR